MTAASGAPALARARAELAQVAFAAHLGVRVEAHGDEVVLVLPATDVHVGDASRNSVHGGVVAAVLELAAWLHLRTTDTATPEAAVDTVETVDFTSAFVREVRLVDLVVHARTVRRGRRFVHVRVDAWQGERDDPVAAGQGTFALG